jgi:hypothetical protein
VSRRWRCRFLSLSDATSRGLRDERSEMWATATTSGIGGRRPLEFAGLGCRASALAREALVGTGGREVVVHMVGPEGRT